MTTKVSLEELENIKFMIENTFKSLPPSQEASQSFLEKVIIPIIDELITIKEGE